MRQDYRDQREADASKLSAQLRRELLIGLGSWLAKPRRAAVVAGSIAGTIVVVAAIVFWPLVEQRWQDREGARFAGGWRLVATSYDNPMRQSIFVTDDGELSLASDGRGTVVFRGVDPPHALPVHGGYTIECTVRLAYADGIPLLRRPRVFTVFEGEYMGHTFEFPYEVLVESPGRIRLIHEDGGDSADWFVYERESRAERG